MKKLSIVMIALIVQTLNAQQYGWGVVSQPSLSPSVAIQFVDSLNGWMGQVNNDRIFRTRDGGYTWVPTQMPAPVNTITSISMVDTSIGWAVGDAGVIFKTTNGGQTWTTQFRNLIRYYYANATTTELKSLAGGSHANLNPPDTAFVNRTTNGGAQWQEQALPPLQGIGAMVFVDTLNGFAAARPSTLLRTRDGGVRWIASPLPASIGRISFIDTLHGWGLSSPRFLLRTTNGGVTWDTLMRADGDFGLNTIKFVDTLNGWAFGDTVISGSFRELIYRTTNGGTSWFAESLGPRPECGTGTALDRYHAWAVSVGGHVLKYGLITGAPETNRELPRGYHLGQNYPNPFNPLTKIEYSIPKRTHVRITVSDLLGRTVRILVNTEQQAGAYSIEFDARVLASGQYFYSLKTNEFEETKSMIVLR